MNNSKKKFLKLPEYPGGKVAFRKYIKENLVYPKEAFQNQVQGIVYLSAEISDNGDVLQVWIEKGVGAGCNEEAIRLIKRAKFTGVKNKGVRVKSKKKFRVEFKLPPQKTVNFQLVKEKKKDSNQKISKSYSYTVSVKKD